jgi:hypothetical protein
MREVRGYAAPPVPRCQTSARRSSERSRRSGVKLRAFWTECMIRPSAMADYCERLFPGP